MKVYICKYTEWSAKLVQARNVLATMATVKSLIDTDFLT